MDASAIRAKIKAIDKTLADLQAERDRGYMDPGQYSRLKTDWERQKAELEAQLTTPPQGGEPEGGAFTNRDDELHRLQPERLRASRSPCTLIGAPAGYGKTCLLQRLLHLNQNDQNWCARYVDLGQPVENQIAHVTRAIAGREPSGGQAPDDGPDAAREQVCRAVVQELSAPLDQGRHAERRAVSPVERRAVLLIFDAVERLDAASTAWLCQTLHELQLRTHAGGRELITVRVIIAGRAVEHFWETYERVHPRPPAPARINLRPLDKNSIQELVWDQARALHIALDDQTVAQITDEIQYLSDGHPAVIRRLLDDLAGQTFAIGPADAYYWRHLPRLARAHLSPVADDLLAGLDEDLRAAVQALSVFRRVNANTVQTLVQAGALPAHTNEVELLGNLSRLHLLDGPSIKEPFYRDRLTRRVLALDLAHRSPASRAHYLRLNEAALALYQGWIHQGQALPDSYLKATQRLLSVVEWLFHALQAEDLDEDALRASLQGHIQALAEGGPSVAELISDEIQRDSELTCLLRHRLGADGVAGVCGWLNF